jgi:multiple antibiotic resistance protein
MDKFWLAFIPLFVAVDAIGVLPMYLGLTSGIGQARSRRIVIQSVITALIVGLLFLVVGKWVLSMLGITIADFMIAGGVILFILSATDLLSFEKPERTVAEDDIGPVPIGVPLIVGPAVLTTGMLLIDEYGMFITMLSLAINILLVGVVLWFAPLAERVLGKKGAKIISKLAGLLLASFAVMMVRRGILDFLR